MRAGASAAQTAALDAVFATDHASVVERESRAFDAAVSSAQPLVLFGAGGLGKKTLGALRDAGRLPVAFADNDPSRHGTFIEGIPVLSARDAAARFGDAAAFIVTIFMDSSPVPFQARHAELAALGCRTVLPFYPLFWKYPSALLPHYAFDLPHRVLEAEKDVRALWQSLGDDESRIECLAQLRWRLDADSEELPPAAAHTIYFPRDLFALRADEVFVDCGAFDGDTVRSFARQSEGQFEKLITFEPDPVNFDKLKRTIAALPPAQAARVVPHHLAVSNGPGTLRLDARGAPSSNVSQSGEYVVECAALDRVLADERVTFLKMDVEGAEVEALQGCGDLIRRCRPTLALSAYHLPHHLWRLASMVRELHDGYAFYLRRYSPVLFDDLVLYAVPSDRRATA